MVNEVVKIQMIIDFIENHNIKETQDTKKLVSYCKENNIYDCYMRSYNIIIDLISKETPEF